MKAKSTRWNIYIILYVSYFCFLIFCVDHCISFYGSQKLMSTSLGFNFDGNSHLFLLELYPHIAVSFRVLLFLTCLMSSWRFLYDYNWTWIPRHACLDCTFLMHLQDVHPVTDRSSTLSLQDDKDVHNSVTDRTSIRSKQNVHGHQY